MINSLSILMPTYNCAPFIECAIKSILNQTFKEFEFLIIDDGSTDNTDEIVRKFDDSRIKYIKRNHEGFAHAANYGLMLCQNDFIARMDADDIAMPERFKIQIDFLNSHPEYKIVSCWYAIFSKTRISYIVRTPVKHEDIIKNLVLHSVICHPGVIFSKQEITTNDAYLENTREDYDLWLRLKDTIKFYNIPEILMLLRQRKDSLSRQSSFENNRLVYQAQKPFYSSKIISGFDTESEIENMLIKGWREWFYGDKLQARKIWWNINLLHPKHIKILGAFLASYLPDKYFVQVKNLRIKHRIFFIFDSLSLKKRLKYILSRYNDTYKIQ